MSNRMSQGMCIVLVAAGIALLGSLEAGAQATPDKSAAFLQQTQATAKNAWGLLSTIGSVVIGGGALISLGMGMYRGQWGQAAISFVAGAAGLLSIWGVGQALGY
jgi:hypothetical protein